MCVFTAHLQNVDILDHLLIVDAHCTMYSACGFWSSAIVYEPVDNEKDAFIV